MKVPVRVTARRAKDGTYLVVYTVGAGTSFKGKGKGPNFGGPLRQNLTVLGDEWSLNLIVSGKDSTDWPNQLELAGVSAADAEKLVEMTEATVKGKIEEISLVDEYVRLVLGDVQIDGKKTTPRKRERAAPSFPPAM